jgi:hypothetical protein
MATRHQDEQQNERFSFKLPPPIDEEGWKRLEATPEVIVRRRHPRKRGWTFRTDVQAQPGFSVVGLIDQDDEPRLPGDTTAS